MGLYSHYKYVYSYIAVIKFRRLTSTELDFRLDSQQIIYFNNFWKDFYKFPMYCFIKAIQSFSTPKHVGQPDMPYIIYFKWDQHQIIYFTFFLPLIIYYKNIPALSWILNGGPLNASPRSRESVHTAAPGDLLSKNRITTCLFEECLAG